MNITDISTIELASIYRKLDYPHYHTGKRHHQREQTLNLIMEELHKRASKATEEVK